VSRAALGRPAVVLAVVRLAAVPVFFATERLVDHPVARSGPFGELLVLAGVYAIAAALAAFLRPEWDERLRFLPVADFALIVALVATSGGPFSQLRYAFFILPIAAALLLRPALTAGASLAGIVAYALVSVTWPEERPDALEFELTQLMHLAWMGATATALSALLTVRSREVADLAESRGRLLVQALDAEDRARRRLAEALHDEAIQNLLAARHELQARDDGGSLDLVEEGLDQTVHRLREAVFDLHPYLLDQVGLAAALQAVVDRHARRTQWLGSVRVEPEATGVHDQLLFSIGRELVVNAAKHAAARVLDVEVRRRGGEIVLRVADDGRGLVPEEALGAARTGHIGLASVAERAEAAGGSFTLESTPGTGTAVTVRLPAPALAARALAPA